MIHINVTFSAWFLVIPAIIAAAVIGFLWAGGGDGWDN